MEVFAPRFIEIRPSSFEDISQKSKTINLGE